MVRPELAILRLCPHRLRFSAALSDDMVCRVIGLQFGLQISLRRLMSAHGILADILDEEIDVRFRGQSRHPNARPSVRF